MRVELSRYAGEDVMCLAFIGRFEKGVQGQDICLFCDVYIHGELVAKHLWARKEVTPKLFLNFKHGQWVTFYAYVHRYQRLNSPVDEWEYGIRHITRVRAANKKEYMKCLPKWSERIIKHRQATRRMRSSGLIV
jgi:hypothetical protein